MAKMKSKTKKTLKIVGLALAGVVALGLLSFGIKAIVDYTKNDLKKVTLIYDVGNLGSDGKYVSDESTLYTKEAFLCDGLQIKLDFDNQINYQIYYYDDLDNFIESTDVLSESYSGVIHDGYARLVIIPTNDEDEKISWTERITYPNQMTVKVKKNQNIKYVTAYAKRLSCVDNVSMLRFVHGDFDINSNGSYSFISTDKYAVTSKDLLVVKGGEKITFNDISEVYGVTLFCMELTEINGNIICQKKTTMNNGVSLVLEKKTQYCLFVYQIIDETTDKLVEIPESVLSNSFDILSITVSK